MSPVLSLMHRMFGILASRATVDALTSTLEPAGLL